MGNYVTATPGELRDRGHLRKCRSLDSAMRQVIGRELARFLAANPKLIPGAVSTSERVPDLGAAERARNSIKLCAASLFETCSTGVEVAQVHGTTAIPPELRGAPGVQRLFTLRLVLAVSRATVWHYLNEDSVAWSACGAAGSCSTPTRLRWPGGLKPPGETAATSVRRSALAERPCTDMASANESTVESRVRRAARRR